MGSLKPNPAPTLLAPLHIGDRLPWKLDGRGEPQWVTVIEAVAPAASRSTSMLRTVCAVCSAMSSLIILPVFGSKPP